MPRINIAKVDRPVCEHCGLPIKTDEKYCEIVTATKKELKLHRMCALELASSILVAFKETEELYPQETLELKMLRDYLNKE